MTRTKFIADAGKQEIVVMAEFNAPRENVFKAFTNPNLIAQWWGPKNITTKVDKLDLRKGGTWRFVQHDPQQNEYAFNGVYHEIRPPERLVYTFEYEGEPGHVGLIEVKFEGCDGKTTVTEKFVYLTIEDREGMLKAGMESGEIESLGLLAELVERK